MKTCKICNQTLSLELFNKRRAECKVCQKQVDKQWRTNNPELIKNNHREYYKNNKEKVHEYLKQWRENNPELHTKTIKKTLNKLKPGIYLIKNQITGEKYIGQSIKPYTRRVIHFSKLSKNSYHQSSLPLQEAMQQYGKQSFVFGIIEHCPPEQLLEREKYYINLYKPEYNEYNTTT